MTATALDASLQGLAQQGVPLSRYTTMKVGGRARWCAEPSDEQALCAVLHAVWKSGLPLQAIGAGSNLVASDEGFDGVILKLGAGFDWIRIEDSRLYSGGATLLPRLTKAARENRLGNMEWACGIPGSVGGSVRGNAGARGFNGTEFESRDAAADLLSVVAYDRSGHRHRLDRAAIRFAYRQSSLGDLIVVEASFQLKPLTEAQAALHGDAIKKLLSRRKATQPVNAASAGCIWKNPDQPSCAGAGALIESLGLKGFHIGGAAISPLHANFIVNTGDASGKDVRDLMQHVEAQALNSAGIKLAREVRLLENNGIVETGPGL